MENVKELLLKRLPFRDHLETPGHADREGIESDPRRRCSEFISFSAELIHSTSAASQVRKADPVPAQLGKLLTLKLAQPTSAA